MKINPFCTDLLQQGFLFIVSRAILSKNGKCSVFIPKQNYLAGTLHLVEIGLLRNWETVSEFWVVQWNCQMFWHLENNSTFHDCTVPKSTDFWLRQLLELWTVSDGALCALTFRALSLSSQVDILKHNSVTSGICRYRNKMWHDHLEILHKNKICSLVTSLSSVQCTTLKGHRQKWVSAFCKPISDLKKGLVNLWSSFYSVYSSQIFLKQMYEAHKGDISLKCRAISTNFTRFVS